MDIPVTSSSSGSGPPPIAFVVAVWLGMSQDEILRGLAEGWVAPPPGSPEGWTPPDWAPSDPVDSTTEPTSEPADIGASDSGSTQEASGDATPTAPTRESVEAWLRSIDETFAPATLDGLWQGSGADDAARGTWWRGYLQRVLGVAGDKTGGDGAALDAAISAAAAAPDHAATIVSLAGRTGADVAELAKGDAGIRYALDHMDPLALTGNRALVASTDPGGELDRFDPNTGEKMITDDFIGDRSKFVAWKLRRDAGGDLAIPGDARWTFVDRARVGADGTPFTLTLDGAQAGAATVAHQVVFGTTNGDIIGGGSADDRLYGGTGDDFVRGGAGSDRLEGGRGADTLVGGRGDDALVGGVGEDDLDGGSGQDTIEGDAGDDTLTGGRGDDMLDGGAGDDTYLFDGGDGRDVIVDADGRGHVVVDGVQVSGAAMKRDADNVWRGGDGQLEFRYARAGDDPAVLTIRAAADGSVHNDEIHIRGWHNGELGITLGDGSAQALAESNAPESVDDSSAVPGSAALQRWPAVVASPSVTDDNPAPAELPIVEGPLAAPIDGAASAPPLLAIDPPSPIDTLLTPVVPFKAAQASASPASVPDIPDAPTAPTESTPAPIADVPPEVTEASHPLDSLWALHDRALGVLSGSLVDIARVDSATSSFLGLGSDAADTASDGGGAGALGAAEIAAASSFADDGAIGQALFDAADLARSFATTLAPPDVSFSAALNGVAGGTRRPHAS